MRLYHVYTYRLAALLAAPFGVQALPPPTTGGTMEIEVSDAAETLLIQPDYQPPRAGLPLNTIGEALSQTRSAGHGVTTFVPGATAEIFTLDPAYASSWFYKSIVLSRVWSKPDEKSFQLHAERGEIVYNLSGPGGYGRSIFDGRNYIHPFFSITSFWDPIGGSLVGSPTMNYLYWDWGTATKVWYLPNISSYWSSDSDGTERVFNRGYWRRSDDRQEIIYPPIGTVRRTGSPGHYDTQPAPPLDPQSTYASLKNGPWSFSGAFQSLEPYAHYSFTDRAAAASKTAYKIANPDGMPRIFAWQETFTPEGATEPTDKQLMYWSARQGETESPVYYLDPFGERGHGDLAGHYRVETYPMDLTAELAVDLNRDGRIQRASEFPFDQTSADQPFRFWINDDVDRQHMVDGSDSEEDDLGGGEQIGLRADCLEDRPQSRRDLEDYARLWISTQGLNSAFKDETNPLYLGLQWTDTNGTTPAIKIVKHIETDGGTKYLTDEAVAQQQYSAAAAIQGLTNTYPNLTLVDASDTDGRYFVLPKSLFSDLSETAPKTYLLFEGVQVGKGQLRLVILKKDGSTYTKIGDGPGVWMDLKKIEDFYERWTVGDTGGGTPWSAAVRKKTTLAADGNAYSYSDGFAYADDAPEEKKYILYVHGWNMQAWEKNRFAETAFKRLYWQGYKGRFGVFCWPSTYSFEPPLSAILDGTNYDQGEWAAWKSATPLKDLLVDLNGTYAGQVNVMAHSMGNVVTGEALRLASQGGTGSIVRAYAACQAALPAHCYDGSRAEDIAAVFGFWTSIGRLFDGSTQLPNVYPDWLTGNSAAAGRRVSFYNENDYALWHDVWELNQAFKPDRPDGSTQPWYYGYEDNLGTPPNLHSSFIRFDHYNADADPVGVEERQLGTQAAVGDRYEIMAFASESRTKAVGAAGALPGFQAVNLQGAGADGLSIWPTDSQSVKLHDGLNYSAHKWHSAQFRSTNMRQKGFWKELLGSNGFNLTTMP